MSTSVRSSPIFNLWLYLDSERQKSPPRPLVSGQILAIIIVHSAHSTFFSQVRQRPKLITYPAGTNENYLEFLA